MPTPAPTPPTPAPTTPAPTPPTPAPAETPIKFFQWNVYYNNKDVYRIAGIIKPNDADVVGLNELTVNPFDLAAQMSTPGRVYAVQPGVTGGYVGYGTDIFYDTNRFEALEGGKEEVYCYGTRGGARAANWCVLRALEGGAVLITGGTHLSYCAGNSCDPTQECELNRLYARFNEMKEKYNNAPVAWMGDLNHGINDRIIENLLEGKIGPEQVFPVNDLAMTNANTYYSGGGAIDHILGEPNFHRVSGGRTGQGTNGQWLAGSDHFPIYADTLLGNVTPLPWTPVPTYPPNYCAGLHEDPFNTNAVESPCCPDLYKCLVEDAWTYICVEWHECSGCASCTASPETVPQNGVELAAALVQKENASPSERPNHSWPGIPGPQPRPPMLPVFDEEMDTKRFKPVKPSATKG